MGLGPKSNVDPSWINYRSRDAVYCRIGPIGLLLPYLFPCILLSTENRSLNPSDYSTLSDAGSDFS